MPDKENTATSVVPPPIPAVTNYYLSLIVRPVVRNSSVRCQATCFSKQYS